MEERDVQHVPCSQNQTKTANGDQCPRRAKDEAFGLGRTMDQVRAWDVRNKVWTAPEIESIMVNGVWTLIDPLKRINPIGCKWIFNRFCCPAMQPKRGG